MSTAAPSPGWYADPAGAPQWRYWDGVQWTEQAQSWFLDARTAVGQTLELRRGGVGLGGKPDDLRLGDGVVARLTWGGIMNRFSGDLTVQADDGAWRLDQQGLLQPRVLIFDPSGQVGRYEWQNIQKGGPLTFADGRWYQWASEFISRGMVHDSSQWWLWDSRQRAVLGARVERGTTTVNLRPEAGEVPEIGRLAGLAAYLVLRWLDAQASRRSRRRHSSL